MADTPTPVPPAPVGDYRPVRRRRVPLWRVTLLCALAVLLCSAGAVLFLMRSEPAYWRAQQLRMSRVTPAQGKATADEVENRLLALFGEGAVDPNDPAAVRLAAQLADSDEPQRLVLTCDEINAWLKENLRDWMTSRDYAMPEQIARPMVAVEGGRLMIAFEYDSPGFSQVFAAACSPRVLENGKMRLRVQEVYAGRLPLPTSSIGVFLRRSAPADSQAAKVGDWLDKLDQAEFKPVARLTPTLKVRVVAYRLTDDGIELTLKRERPAKPNLIAEVKTE